MAGGRWYRRWAREAPLEYRLAFGSPIGGYSGTDDTSAASARSSAVLLEVMARAVDDGRVDDAKVEALLDSSLRAGLAAWSACLPRPLPTPALGAALICYAALHGALDLELNGHLPLPVRDAGSALFEVTLRQTIQSLLL
jgi:hypothetical protein